MDQLTRAQAHTSSDHSQANFVPRVVAIAGTDPSGGAGLHADLKGIGAAGGYGMAAVTAIVSQNTHGVTADIFYPPIQVLADQLNAISQDVTIDAVKIGMLGNTEVIGCVKEWLQRVKPPIVVLDPVMVATSGDRLIDDDATAALIDLVPLATVITPNTPEMAILANEPEATNREEAIAQAQRIAARLGVSVVAKAGHLTGKLASNWWVDADGLRSEAIAARVDTTNTHGTGCSLSSALATRLALEPPEKALEWTTAWLNEAIYYGSLQNVGKPGGHGPVDAFHQVRKAAAAAQPVIKPPFSADLATYQTPRIPAAGPATLRLWEHAAPWFAAIMNMPFIRQMGDGTLLRDQYLYYINQDAMYLSIYAPALQKVSDLAAREGLDEIAAYYHSAVTFINEGEMELHRSFDVKPVEFSRVNRSYTDMLLARTSGDDLAVAISAVLPCAWYYAEVGAYLQSDPSNPYHDWITMYADVPFKNSAIQAIKYMEQVSAGITPDDPRWAAIDEAFLTASRYEFEFFEQGELVGSGF